MIRFTISTSAPNILHFSSLPLVPKYSRLERGYSLDSSASFHRTSLASTGSVSAAFIGYFYDSFSALLLFFICNLRQCQQPQEEQKHHYMHKAHSCRNTKYSLFFGYSYAQWNSITLRILETYLKISHFSRIIFLFYSKSAKRSRPLRAARRSFSQQPLPASSRPP